MDKIIHFTTKYTYTYVPVVKYGSKYYARMGVSDLQRCDSLEVNYLGGVKTKQAVFP